MEMEMESSRRAPPNMNMDFLLLHMPIPSQPLLSRRPSLQIADPVVPRTSPLNLPPLLWCIPRTTPAVGLMMTTLVVGLPILRKIFPP